MPAKKNSPARRLRSLKVTAAFRAFVLDQLADLEDLTPRAMFGGVGLYSRGIFFGIIASDVLYLKVDDGNRSDYERAGMPPFQPYPDRSGTMEYFAVPLNVLENADELVQWARKAVEVAKRSEGRPSAPRIRRTRRRAAR